MHKSEPLLNIRMSLTLHTLYYYLLDTPIKIPIFQFRRFKNSQDFLLTIELSNGRSSHSRVNKCNKGLPCRQVCNLIFAYVHFGSFSFLISLIKCNKGLPCRQVCNLIFAYVHFGSFSFLISLQMKNKDIEIISNTTLDYKCFVNTYTWLNHFFSSHITWC